MATFTPYSTSASPVVAEVTSILRAEIVSAAASSPRVRLISRSEPVSVTVLLGSATSPAALIVSLGDAFVKISKAAFSD